jgi:hypothetical protein
MKIATYGTYSNGNITLDETNIQLKTSRVLVVFLDDKATNKIHDKDLTLGEIYDQYDAWIDTDEVKLIIKAIKESKVSERDISL